MTTETQVRELVLAHLQANAGTEFKLRELPGAIGVAVEADRLPDILAPEVEAGTLGLRRAGRGVFYWAPAGDEPAPVPADFNAAAWVDGDVDLYGLIELEDGGHRMTPAMLAKFKRLVTWMPA